MTAGSGLVHAELSPREFKEHGGPLEILQLWVNLPSRLKMTEPRYSGVQETEMPLVPIAEGRGTLQLASGEFAGKTGPISSLTDVFMSIVRLDQDSSQRLPAPIGRNVFFYVVEGAGSVSNIRYRKWQLFEFAGDAEAIEVRAEEPTLLIFGHAEPIAEPVVAHGPFVMNSREEIVAAYRDYEAGKFHRDAPLKEVGH